MSDYIPATEAARRLGVSARTIQNWCNDRVLRHTRIRVGCVVKYFVHSASFDKLIADNEVIPEPQRKPGRPDRLKAFEGGR